MDKDFTKRIIALDDVDLAKRAIRERRDDILIAIEEKRLEPSDDLMKELAELNIALGEAGPEAGHG